MHYRNGRPATNGDKIVLLEGGKVVAAGMLRDATPGNDYCNGYVQRTHEPSTHDPIACMCDCLHVDDVAEILAEKGLDKRPAGM
jgi:ABC-type proline/glycine betaine transport system ATPase subunit